MAKRGRQKKPLTLTAACAALLKELELDLRARLDDEPEVAARFAAEFTEAQTAGRTGRTQTDWLTEQLTQIGASWILACVFVRFAEDNGLLERPMLAGRAEGEAGAPSPLSRAQDAERAYYAEHPTHAEPEYLAHVLTGVAHLPGMSDLLDSRHALLWRLAPRVDGARKLLGFFRATDDESGQLRWDFTDPELDTRFLGDLYQDLSEAVRKHYALLQTPDFVEAFILDRTLEPAVETFGLQGFRMIDPTCGSGHFLLGGFERLLAHWQEAEPGTEVRELVKHALGSIYGVDLNPYAVAIARFRLVVAALKACGLNRLADAPDFTLHLTVGDSLYHGRRFAQSSGKFSGFEADYEFPHVYGSEVESELREILHQQYHCVVGNPPYITPKDKALNAAYRERYGSCHREYALSVPFLERFVDLALEGGVDAPSGFTGQITSNSFMKREFGSKLIEGFFPKWDLTHVIDTSGAYIPGHGTPTVVLFIRNQRPRLDHVRAVLGIRGEPSTPADPADGEVWTEIYDNVDHPGFEGRFVSVANVERERFSSHPWTLGGGGASELKELIEERSTDRLGDLAESVGFCGISGEDDALTSEEPRSLERHGVRSTWPFGKGDQLRDWAAPDRSWAVWPYNDAYEPDSEVLGDRGMAYLWPRRTTLRARRRFSKLVENVGIAWWEWRELYPQRFRTPLSIAFACIATHNHFVLDRGGKVFKQSAPVIKLPPDATEDDHYALLAILNSSLACFYLRQVAPPKTQTTGMDQEAFRVRRDIDANKVEMVPVKTSKRSMSLALAADVVAQELRQARSAGMAMQVREKRGRLVALQEELDWSVYHDFGLVGSELLVDEEYLPAIRPEERAFEVELGFKVATDMSAASWFEYWAREPVFETPAGWAVQYRRVVEGRRDALRRGDVSLLEAPENKRRWPEIDIEGDLAAQRETLALGVVEDMTRSRNVPATAAALADQLVAGTPQVTEASVVATLEDSQQLGVLIEREAIPFLERLRFKDTGLRKARAWHETWRLQRIEDPFLDEQEALLTAHFGPEPADQRRARAHVACWKTTDKITKERNLDEAQLAELGRLREAWMAIDARRQAAVGGETPPVPPKYEKEDFRSPTYWRLRGKLDVPKERFISYPFCSPDGDDSLLIGWAGWDHEQRAGALAQILEARKSEGWTGERLAPILLGIDELLFWLEKWHGDLADEYRGYLDQEVAAAGLTLEAVRAWEPPAGTRRRAKGQKKSAEAE